MRTRTVPLAMAVTMALVTPPAALANCGAEGCPLAPRGPETSTSRFSFDVGYQAVEQDRYWNGGHAISSAEALQAEGGIGHVLEQDTRTRTTVFRASATLTRRWSLQLSLPYVDRVHRHALVHHANFLIESEWHMQGLGDATAATNWDLLDGARWGTLTFVAGAKFPTGETDVAPVDGEVPEPSARPGSGSTDALAGLQYRRAVSLPRPWGARAEVPLTASVGARFNGRGSEGYRMGNEWDASVGAAYPVANAVRLLAQLNGSWHARDEAGSTDAEPHHTGSSALFASPGVLVRLLPGMTVFGYGQFRLAEHTNGPQLVSPMHAIFGLAWSAN
jgi:hypothetical protein